MPINAFSNYPNGFTHGVTIRGVPILNVHSGNVFWVDSGTGNDSGGADGSITKPFATIDYAIGRCTASNGDIIAVFPGHAETLTTAGQITIDVAGISIVGMGNGNNRPVLTCTPGAVGTNVITWTAADCSFENIVCIAGLDAITNPFNISGARAWLDIEWQDASATVEAETVVLTTAAADNLYIRLKYLGFPAGNACVAPIKLVGATDARIEIDFYGIASTAVVNFVTTLSTNVKITGYAYNSTDTSGAKLVVDTIGSSLWYADIEAGAAGATYRGGSAAALAADDISTVAARLGTDADTNAIGAVLTGAAGVATWPTAAAYANAVNFAEVLAYIQDGVRRGSGTSMAANKSVADALGTDGTTITDSATSVLGVIGSNTGTTAFSSSSVVANVDGNVLERDEVLQIAAAPTKNHPNYFTVTADMTSATWNTVAAHEIATVTGAVRMQIMVEVTATVITTGTNGTIALGFEGNASAIFTATALDAAVTGDVFSAVYGSAATTPASGADAQSSLTHAIFDVVVVNGMDVGYTIATNAATTGTLTFHVWWQPLSSTGAVTAGAGGAL